MPHRAPRPGVSRDRFHSVDAAEVQRFLGERFTDVVALEPVGGLTVECGYESLATEAFVVGHMWMTVPTTWQIDQMPDTVLVQHLRTGCLTHSSPPFGEVRAGPGGTVVAPPGEEFTSSADAFDMDVVALDTAQVRRYAEYAYGIDERDLRFTGLTPPTTSQREAWDDVSARVRDEMLGNPVLNDSAIVVDNAFQCLASAFLATFPTTVSSGAEDEGARRRVPESALRAVREFLRVHAGEPVGPEDIAAVAGAPAGAVLRALERRDARHPAHLLWEARLQGVRRDLSDGEPGTTDVVTVAARWGFARPGAFRFVYERAFGEPPEATLRS